MARFQPRGKSTSIIIRNLVSKLVDTIKEQEGETEINVEIDL